VYHKRFSTRHISLEQLADSESLLYVSGAVQESADDGNVCTIIHRRITQRTVLTRRVSIHLLFRDLDVVLTIYITTM